MLYSGSPLSYSFAEANQQKGVLLLEFQPDKTLEIKKILLTSGRPLLRKRFEDIETAASWLAEHPEAIVELTLAMEEYLSAREKNRLLEINPDVFIVPELRGKLLEDKNTGHKIDLSQSVEQLFRDYFEFTKGLAPDEAVINIFKEVLAEEPEDN